MSGLLAGARVLDLTNVLAGPFCCYQLAQLGADVIKVEVPGSGDLARQLGADPELNRRGMGASFLAQNAGKRSITINLKSDKGRDVFRRLVASADVVVENFRPGVMDRLGLGYGALKAVKSDIIYCAISGFGQDGPLKFNPAYDQIIQGLSGVMSVTGDKTSAPLRVGYPVADTMGGITAAFAIAAALFRRERSGEGELIDVSMLESTLVAMGWAVSNWLIAGVKAEPMGNENMTASPSGAFHTGDGLLNIAANKQEQFETLCRLIGRDELVVDPRFAGREDRKRHRFELKREIEQALAARAATEWAALLEQARRPGGRGARRARRARASADQGTRVAAHLRAGARRRSSRQRGARGLPPGERRPGAGDAAAGARRRHRRYPGRARLFETRPRRARARERDMSSLQECATVRSPSTRREQVL